MDQEGQKSWTAGVLRGLTPDLEASGFGCEATKSGVDIKTPRGALWLFTWSEGLHGRAAGVVSRGVRRLTPSGSYVARICVCLYFCVHLVGDMCAWCCAWCVRVYVCVAYAEGAWEALSYGRRALSRCLNRCLQLMPPLPVGRMRVPLALGPPSKMGTATFRAQDHRRLHCLRRSARWGP
jgi:hypothetical protein